MPTINATSFPAEAYVLVEVDWTDQPTVDFVKVTRRNTVTGETVDLRPYIMYDENNGIALSCGQALFWDTEPPLNVPLEYCTVASNTPTTINANPTFETGIIPWLDSGCVLSQSSTFAHSGTFSGLVVSTATLAEAKIIDNTDYPVVTGVPINAQAWMFTPQGWNGAYITLRMLYNDGTFEDFSSPIFPVRVSVWQLMQFEFTPTRPGVLAVITISVTGFPPNTLNIYFDDIYIRQAAPVAVTACDTVTVTSSSVWLKSPLYPCSDIEIGLCSPAMDFDCEEDSRVSYAGMADDTRPANTVLSDPANRTYPIPTSRPRRKPRSELRLITHDCDARDAVVLANEPGTPLLFQAPADYCIPDRYISVDELTEMRISVDQRDDFRVFGLPYAVVQRPEGPANGPCGLRIMDLCDIYTSWQALVLAGFDWVDLLLGAGSNNGPGSDPSSQRTWGDVEIEFANWAAVEAGGTRDWGELRDGL